MAMRGAALVGAQQLDQIGKVGLMQSERELAHALRVMGLERGLDRVQELRAKRPLLVAQLDFACGVLHHSSDRRN